MKISSWNVNSVNARLDHVKRYIKEFQPDVLMLQELKTLDFPMQDINSIGYQVHAVGQKSYNGVAIISKHPIEVINDCLPGDESDEQARYLEVDINSVRLINIYLPNGNPCPGEKYDYKLKWMDRLYDRLSSLTKNNTPFLIGGDFNVIPEEKDCYNPKLWENDALFKKQTRAAFRSLLHLGLTDAFRMFNNNNKQYTFWDYQAGAWQKNNGIRIDHFLLSPYIADITQTCCINKAPRAWEKPSDHTPIELTIQM